MSNCCSESSKESFQTDISPFVDAERASSVNLSALCIISKRTDVAQVSKIQF